MLNTKYEKKSKREKTIYVIGSMVHNFIQFHKSTKNQTNYFFKNGSFFSFFLWHVSLEWTWHLLGFMHFLSISTWEELRIKKTAKIQVEIGLWHIHPKQCARYTCGGLSVFKFPKFYNCPPKIAFLLCILHVSSL